MSMAALDGPRRLWREHRRSIITYPLLNLPLVVLSSAAVLAILVDIGDLDTRTCIRALGIISLVLLVVGLALRPLAVALKMPALLRYRRAVGLAAFFYAVAHTVIYIYVSQMWEASFPRFMRRTYLLVGIAALYFLIPLAITSTTGAVRRMGRLRWERLHMAVYPALALTLVHYAMPAYSGGIVYYYAAAALALMGWRLWRRVRR